MLDGIMDGDGMRIKCPTCMEELDAPEGVVEGQHIYCTSCGTKFSYSAGMGENGEGRSSSYLIIKCRECGAKIVVGDDIQEGQHVRCPFCEMKFSYSAAEERAGEEKKDKLVKCPLCGEIIVVDDDIAIGQHVQCPYCDRKFSYIEKDAEIAKHLKIAKGPKSAFGKIDLDLKERKEVVRIKAKYEDKTRHREWKRKVITRGIAFAGGVLALATSVVAYFAYQTAINTRIEIRNALAQYISDNSKVLQDKHSQYAKSIRECRDELWKHRDDAGLSYQLRSKIQLFESVQNEIDEVINAFSDVAPRLDSMNTTELKVAQAELAIQMKSVIIRIDRIGFSPPVIPPPPPSTRPPNNPPAVTPSCPPHLPHPPKPGVIDQACIDALIEKLKRTGYSFDPALLKQYDLPTQKEILEEMLDDVKRRKEKKGE